MDRKLDFDEIHKLESEMLKAFVRVCERRGLRYYMAGGTLLGAVRHKGFIPWDDDIDILMPRPDYYRFLECADEVERECADYKVAAFELGNLNYAFCKIFDRRTRIEKTYVDDETEQNLWIDVQPMDGLPDDDRAVASLFKKSLRARRLLKLKKAKTGEGKTALRRFFKPAALVLLKPISVKKIVAYIDKIARTYDWEESPFAGAVTIGYGPQEKMPKDEFCEPVKMEFEKMMLNAPKCWDYYLTSLYGDYMTPPPKEQRAVHIMTIWADAKFLDSLKNSENINEDINENIGENIGES